MSHRLFILTNDPVPYGTANANYVRTFAKSVAFAGWKVLVIGMCPNEREEELYRIEEKSDESIEYWNINKSRVGAKNYLNIYFWGAKYYKKALQKFNANAQDYIYLYSTELSTAIAALRFKNISLNHKSYGEVEWFQPFQYKHGRFTPLYLLWKTGFYYRARHFYKAIPISRHLERFCKKNNCNTLVVPAMVESERGNIRENDSLQVNFIYPGSASDKESFPCMIQALSMLSDEEKENVRFHLTGSMTYQKLLSIVNNKSALDSLKKIIIYHGYMEYRELLQLYQETDYLLLARAENVVTLSNFPSKVPEMMNYGIVPVCSHVGDYTDLYLIDGLNSIQFEKDNVGSCLAAIRRAIDYKSSILPEMRNNSRNTAISQFDYKVWSKPIVEFLES